MITSETAKAGPFTGDGETLVFDFSFTALDADHVAVYVDGVKVTTGFTVELLTGGGRVTFEAAPAIGASVAIIRDVPAKQEMDLQNNTAFLPEVIETAFDRLTMMIQQLRDLFSRTPVAPPTEDTTSEELYSRFAGALDTVEEAAATVTATVSDHNSDSSAHSGFVIRQKWEGVSSIPVSEAFNFRVSNAPYPPHKKLYKVQLRCKTSNSPYLAGEVYDFYVGDTLLTGIAIHPAWMTAGNGEVYLPAFSTAYILRSPTFGSPPELIHLSRGTLSTYWEILFTIYY